MATKPINAIFFENASPLRNRKKCTRAPKQVKNSPFQDPDFFEKTAEFDTTSFCKNVSWVKKVRKTKTYFLK